jgi:hypothetical protein
VFQTKKIEKRTLPVNGILRRTNKETEKEREKEKVKVALALVHTRRHIDGFIFVRHSLALLYLPPLLQRQLF